MTGLRDAIEQGRLASFAREFLSSQEKKKYTKFILLIKTIAMAFSRHHK